MESAVPSGFFLPCFVPPPLPSSDGRLSPSSVLLDRTAYISADAVFNATTAVASMSTGTPIHVSFCLAFPPRLSYLCAHFPGPAAGRLLLFVAPGTPAVRCVRQAPRVVSTHADVALICVPIPGAESLVRDFDYFVYTARPQPGASSLERLPKPTSGFRDAQAAILRCPSSAGHDRYVIACLRATIGSDELFRFHLYDSKTRNWSTPRLLRLENPAERDKVLPIPDTASGVLFHVTTKTIILGGPNGTVGWVDLWRGILFCNVLDEMPVLRDMPLPKPSRRNRRDFCFGDPHFYRDISVAAAASGQEHDINNDKVVIKYVEMETRPGEVPLVSRPHHRHSSGSQESSSDSDESDDEAVAEYWKATVWTMPVPISSSWEDWRKDCKIDVTDIVIDNPSHSELLLRLPRHSADPEDATWGLRRMAMTYPTLGLGINGDVIYFLSKVPRSVAGGWVISVNMKSRKLNGVAELDSRKNTFFERYCVPSEISQYLTKATGEAGTLEKVKGGKKHSSRPA